MDFSDIVNRAKMNARRWEVLEFLDRYQRKNSYCPEMREIGDATGITSTSVVNYALAPMIDAGLIDGHFLESGYMAPRTLHLTDLGKELLAWHFEERGGDGDDR
jgi:repressor LexA